MSKEFEKAAKDSMKFIEENGDAPLDNQGNLNNIIKLYNGKQQNKQGFGKELTEETAEDADDYMELAGKVRSKKAALKYAKKAFELEPDNLDAEVMVAELSAATYDKMLENYEQLIQKAEEKLKADGLFEKENVGHFWLLLDTRPYMRLLGSYADCLIVGGKMKLAKAAYEKMLKLCKGDNLGTRYRLMSIYAYFEDEKSALALYKKYPEDSSQFLLPLSLLYYKLGDLKKSGSYLKTLSQVNKDTCKFFQSFKGDNTRLPLSEYSDVEYYLFNTIEELFAAMQENGFLYMGSASYFEWARKKVAQKI